MSKKQENQKKLEQIKADIISSNICPNLAQDATQLVMGHGNPQAEIMFIGEAPGKQEDIQGVPFVGAAGKLLDEMLASINIARKDVYISNIVKYRPPNNRDPLPEEKKAFWPYLLREIKAIGPKVIITLGRHSMGHFLPDHSISDVHGKIFKVKVSAENPEASGVDDRQGEDEKRTKSYRNTTTRVSQSSTQSSATNETGIASLPSEQSFVTISLLPLYHPAAALYNGGLRETLFNDFEIITRIAPSITSQKSGQIRSTKLSAVTDTTASLPPDKSDISNPSEHSGQSKQGTKRAIKNLK